MLCLSRKILDLQQFRTLRQKLSYTSADSHFAHVPLSEPLISGSALIPMKRCPECRRDYYDESLLYCLDDGTALLDGPRHTSEVSLSGKASFDDDSSTAILPEMTLGAEAPTHAQISTTGQTLGASTGARPGKLWADKRFVVAPLIVAVLAVAGFFIYRYMGSSTGQIGSIAVMPFVNDGGDADLEYLSDGMTETLIKSLTGLPGLDVKPRSSVFRYKGKDIDLQAIGKELNIQAILNGRVAQHADELTLSLELVDVQKNSVIWTEQYQRKRSDLVSLQSEIARDVSSKLKAKLSGTEEKQVTRTATADPEAYQAYLKGRYYWNRRTTLNIQKAIEQFKIATDRDPNYALAFVGLADCYAVSNEYTGTPTSETIPLSKAFAERALAIDPQLAEPHTTLAFVYENSWQWAEAEKEFKRAIELNPNYPTTYHWYSIFLKGQGRYDDAAVAVKKAQELDPLSSPIAVNVSRLYHLQNDAQASVNNSLKLIELDPNFGSAYEYLGLAYLTLGRNAEAVAASEKAVELNDRAGITLGDLGFVYASTGKRADAEKVIKELEEKYAAKRAIGQYIAAVYAGLGDKDKAFEWLEKDFQDKNGKVLEIRWEMQFASLKDDPRALSLLKRMGLPT